MPTGGEPARPRKRQGGAIHYRTGPFLVSLQTSHAPLIRTLFDLYPDTAANPEDEIVDFYIRMERPLSLRRWLRPHIRFHLEDISPFDPYPLDHAFPLLEWGLNWCIATTAHQNLMLHSAVVERGSDALILPALPGSGKSTLCAALSHRGWRLLSDEFGVVEPATGLLLPLPRAVPLKNESIRVMRDFAPEAYLGPVFPKTRKGTVSHMRPPADSLRRQQEPARARWLVFPQFERGAFTEIRQIPKSLAFPRLAHNSFNYRLLGATGFRTAAALVRQCDCYAIRYSDLDDAIARLEQTLSAGIAA
jgi:HprK-related kinase A